MKEYKEEDVDLIAEAIAYNYIEERIGADYCKYCSMRWSNVHLFYHAKGLEEPHAVGCPVPVARRVLKEIEVQAEANAELRQNATEHRRLMMELSKILGHDAVSPSMCDLVAITTTVAKERDDLMARISSLDLVNVTVLKAAIAIRDDLRLRAEIYGDGQKVVACGDGVWKQLNMAIDKAVLMNSEGHINKNR